jgi:hypothetical protein
MEGRGTAAVKSAALSGHRNRRDESARRKNGENAGRYSQGHRTHSACGVNRPHSIPPYPPVPGACVSFSGAKFWLMFIATAQSLLTQS